MITIVAIQRKDVTKISSIGNPIVKVKSINDSVFTVEQIIKRIDDDKENVYSKGLNQNEKAEVITYTENGKKHIKTKADALKGNNLENLPTF